MKNIMMKNIQGSEESQAKKIAEKIVNNISDGDYSIISSLVDNMKNWTTDLIEQFIETYKLDNGLDCFDKYGTPCNFNPSYSDGSVYSQENFYFCNDGSGFRYEYDFTTNGDLNDLTLLLSFVYKGEHIEICFDDIHVL